MAADPASSPAREESGAVLRTLPYQGDAGTFVEAIRAGHAGARAALFDRYAPTVRRVLLHVLGPDQDLADLLQEVFVQALTSIHRLEDPTRLQSWLVAIATFTARGEIRRRKRRKWLRFERDAGEATEAPANADDEDLRALRAFYAVLEEIDADERVAFALRYVDGMEVSEIADRTDVSASTVKRRIRRAQERFLSRANQHPALAPWIGRSRWSNDDG